MGVLGPSDGSRFLNFFCSCLPGGALDSEKLACLFLCIRELPGFRSKSSNHPVFEIPLNSPTSSHHFCNEMNVGKSEQGEDYLEVTTPATSTVSLKDL